MDDKIPVRLSENPNSLVNVARKDPATSIEIRYSKAASKIYIILLLFKAVSDIFSILSTPIASSLTQNNAFFNIKSNETFSKIIDMRLCFDIMYLGDFL